MSLSSVKTITRVAISFPPDCGPGLPPPGGPLFDCQRCIGGQVFFHWGEFKCLQCSAEHTGSGELIKALLGFRPKYDYEGKRFNRNFF